MFTSDTEPHARRFAKTAFIYLVISLFCAIFGRIYEFFSHGVISYSMIYAFAYPLAGGALPFSAMSISKKSKYPGSLSCNLYHCGIATCTVGSIIKGVLEIYGTTNSLTDYYHIVGVPLIIIGVITYFISCVSSPRK